MLVTATIPLLGQKIEHETNDGSQIVHLKTALNHLTVIELREPVIQVATGSQSFKVEWRENKVFVQPTEADASTNLFIWTASERLNYELEPAGAVATMDFAVDLVPVQTVAPKPASVAPPQPSPIEVLLAGKPVRQESTKPTKKPVEIVIRDIYEENGRSLVRFAVRNRGNHAYDVTTPQSVSAKGRSLPTIPLRSGVFATRGSGSGSPHYDVGVSIACARKPCGIFPSCAGPRITGRSSSVAAPCDGAHSIAFSVCKRRPGANRGPSGALGHG